MRGLKWNFPFKLLEGIAQQNHGLWILPTDFLKQLLVESNTTNYWYDKTSSK